MSSPVSSCVCTGIRTCGICKPDLYAQVSEKHDENSTVKIIQCLWCPECKNIFQESSAKSILTCCKEHQQRNDNESKIMNTQHFTSLGLKPFCGFDVVPNFVAFFDERDGETNNDDSGNNNQEKLIINYLDYGRAIKANDEEETSQNEKMEEVDKKNSNPIWQPSQSGRRKVDFGPRANFKQRKAQSRSTFLGFPIELKNIVERVSQQVTKLSSSASSKSSPSVSHRECSFGYRFTCNKGMEIPEEVRQNEGDCECGRGRQHFLHEKEKVKSDDNNNDDNEDEGTNKKNQKVNEDDNENAALFQIVEIAALEYQPSVSSNLDPHMDDAWIWGARVVGVSLLSDSVMTFVQCSSAPSAVCVHLRVPLPRGALFVLSDSSRYHWLHGIQASDIKNRRVSLTIRELSREFSKAEPELAKECLAMAKNFV